MAASGSQVAVELGACPLEQQAASLALIMGLPWVSFISALVQVTWQSEASAKMSINFRRVSRRLIEFFCLSSRLQFGTVQCKVMTVIDCQSTSVK